ncbi:hypothetical protein UPYG_G00125990 [Umbra pygmaea]|uniref:Lymphocyte cytosolic protein 2 n=1 Tax=Umbra pygmaea TaxID=75934 RepID=A0ABD0XN85_UMBPY
MSFDRVPFKSEVMGWNPQKLAEYLRRLELSGCDKVITKYNINGQRFLNMMENDLQKFPKLHAPLITKIRFEINRKEEKKSIFPRRPQATKPINPVPSNTDIPQEEQPWGPDEFSASDDDYESPDADPDDEEGSGGDYESPSEEVDDGGEDGDPDYEPPPSEPPDDISQQFRPAKAVPDGVYIDRAPHQGTNRSQPPPPQRPGPVSSLPSTRLGEHLPPRREQSPQRSGRQPGKLPPPFSSTSQAPPVDRRIKPTLDRTSLVESPCPGRKMQAERPVPSPWRPQTEERSSDPSWMPKPPLPGSANVSRSSSSVTRPPLPGSADVSRSSSSVTRPPVINSRYLADARNEVKNEVPKVNSHTFPRPVTPRPTSHSESLSTNSSTLPSKLQVLQASITRSTRNMSERHTPTPGLCSLSTPANQEEEQDLSPQWYIGQVTRGQAESCLRQVNKDGAFLVRDSSKRSSIQPYTLMVLYQDKVYNIQIRCDQNEYLLGTGLKASETYPMVANIIAHYRQTPLLLIDAKNRGSGQQNQCPLIYPAGRFNQSF